MRRICVFLAVVAAHIAVISTAQPASAEPAVQGAFVSVDPVRLLDTRPGAAAVIHPNNPVPAGSPLTIQVSGNAGVPSNASAVVMNVTVTEPTKPGYLAAYPTGTTPLVSNLNFVAGQTVPNLTTVRLSGDGKVTLALPNTPGLSTHVIADVSGYYIGGSQAAAEQAAGTFVPLTPKRLQDTRDTAAVGANTPLTLDVTTETSGVPADASAVVMNVTVTQPAGEGYAAVRPGNATGTPTVSNINYAPGQTLPNLVTVPLSGGNVQYQASVQTHAIFDIAGYYVGGDPTLHGAFKAVTPARILDTRDYNAVTGYDPVWGGDFNFLEVNSRGGLPGDGVAALVLNAAVVNPASPGYLSLFPSDVAEPPNSSNLNYVNGQTIANLTIDRVGFDGFLGMFSYADTDVIADVSGYFLGGGWKFDSPVAQGLGSSGDIDCVSETFCAASGHLGFATFDGSAWTTRAAPVGFVSELLSCTSPTHCVALSSGSYKASVWDGSSWGPTATISVSSNDVYVTPRFLDLDCTSTAFCMATANNGWATFNGTTWSFTAFPGQGSSGQRSVSCPTQAFCVALSDSGYANTWNGSTWGPDQAALPYEFNLGAIYSVSCTAVTDCTAVNGTEVAIFDGTSWSEPFDIGPDLGWERARAISCAPNGSMCAFLTIQGSFYPSNAHRQQAPGWKLACPTDTFCATLDDTRVTVGRYY